MERYKIIKSVGDGTYGTVYKAVSRSNGEVVAIKKMKKKFYSWEECLTLREIKSLRKLSHVNIVKLKEVIRVNDELHLVFDYLDQDVYQLIKDRTEYLPESQVRSILQQAFVGLAYMHKHGFFHRDMKPENMMITGDMCKIADFGLAREVRSRPPFTDYISTRWYRAPENLLRSTNYNSPVDIFAMGCIMVELYNLRPLAPGANEQDQLFKLCSILGTPSPTDWPEGYKLASAMHYRFPQSQRANFRNLMNNACYEAVQLLEWLLAWDPMKRPSAADCLQHPYFTKYASPSRPPEFLEERPSQNPESRGLRATNSKWSQGSSRIGGNSSKGRYPLPANSKNFLPKLKEMPEPSERKPNKLLEKKSPDYLYDRQQPRYMPPINEQRMPPINDQRFMANDKYSPPDPQRFAEPKFPEQPRHMSKEQPRYMVQEQPRYAMPNKDMHRYMPPEQRLNNDPYRYMPKDQHRYMSPANEQYKYKEAPKKLPPMGSIANSIVGNRMPARGMQKGSILPLLGRHRF